MPEAESELVSGYHVEYSALMFVFFIFAEYLHVVLMASICVCVFFGGWLPVPILCNFFEFPDFLWFFVKLLFVLFIFIIFKAVLPSYRYDQLMLNCWKVYLPLCFFFAIVSYIILVWGFF